MCKEIERVCTLRGRNSLPFVMDCLHRIVALDMECYITHEQRMLLAKQAIELEHVPLFEIVLELFDEGEMMALSEDLPKSNTRIAMIIMLLNKGMPGYSTIQDALEHRQRDLLDVIVKNAPNTVKVFIYYSYPTATSILERVHRRIRFKMSRNGDAVDLQELQEVGLLCLRFGANMSALQYPWTGIFLQSYKMLQMREKLARVAALLLMRHKFMSVDLIRLCIPTLVHSPEY